MSLSWRGALVLASGPLAEPVTPSSFTTFSVRAVPCYNKLLTASTGSARPKISISLPAALYKDLCQQQLPQLSDDQVLCEPIARNTAPCVAYACYKIAQQDPNANIIVAPADHIILKQERLSEYDQNCSGPSTEQQQYSGYTWYPAQPP